MAILYQDDHITCDEDGITVTGYYFPFGSKRLLYGEVEAAERYDMGEGPFGGRWRIWGSGDLKHWFHLDMDRPSKRHAFVLKVRGWARPVLTPARPEPWAEVLESKGVVVRDREA